MIKKEYKFGLVGSLIGFVLWIVLALGAALLTMLLSEPSFDSYVFSIYLVAVFTSPIALIGIGISIMSFYVDKKPKRSLSIVAFILNLTYICISFLGLKCIGEIGV